MSSSNNNVSEQQLAQPPKPEGKPKRMRGKGAKARSTEKFTQAANAKFMSVKREEAMRRLGVFNEDAAALERSLASMQVSTQRRAIPLPIATRGAGFAAVADAHPPRERQPKQVVHQHIPERGSQHRSLRATHRCLLRHAVVSDGEANTASREVVRQHPIDVWRASPPLHLQQHHRPPRVVESPRDVQKNRL
ncbi:hypothetical protein ACJJTC_011517 [Scirpophaga incertulas]